MDTSEYVPENAGCLYYFRQFDERILRPILIYKYKKNKYKPEINFNKLLVAEEQKNKNVAEYLYQMTQSVHTNNPGWKQNFRMSGLSNNTNMNIDVSKRGSLHTIKNEHAIKAAEAICTSE